jgi:ABC-type nitrate/sulfonate/bicarbonate transport system permease component
MAANRKPSSALTMPSQKAARPVTVLVSVGVVLLIWELVVRMLAVRHSSLPSPTRVLLELWREGALLGKHALITGFEALEGLLLALVIGFCLAALTAWFTRAHRIAAPAISFFQKLPLVALAPLVVIWFGYGYSAAAALSFLACFLPVATSVRNGFDSLPAETVEIVEMMGAGPATVFLKVRLPACLPFVASALKTSIPLALAGATVMEFIGSDAGLGYLMLYASAKIDTNQLFATLAVLVLMAVGFYYLIDIVQRVWISWPASVPAATASGRQIPGR